MYKALILPLAKQDVKEAATWYNSKQKGLGKRFTKTVRDKVLYIRQNPQSSSIRYDDTRCAVLDVFPFMVHFTVNDKQKTVVVSAVFHTSRNPDVWKDRK